MRFKFKLFGLILLFKKKKKVFLSTYLVNLSVDDIQGSRSFLIVLSFKINLLIQT